jgi:hypothetical protein
MPDKKSYLNVFELNRALERETLINRTLLSLLLEKGIISGKEWEEKLREVGENQQFKSA